MTRFSGRRLLTVDVTHDPGCMAPPVPAARARGLLRAAARRLGTPEASMGVLFTSDARMRDFNARFRHKNRPTDVLAFPAGERGAHPGDHLGDLAISCEACLRQGRAARHGAAREAEILLLHGLLHLMGYDHESDDGEMEYLERSLRSALLARAAATP